MTPERPSAPRDPLVRGSLLHVGLAHHYALKMLNQGDAVLWTPAEDAPLASKVLLDAGPSRRGWHQFESFLRCPQLWAYQYRDRAVAPRGQEHRITDAAQLYAPMDAPRELAWRQGEWKDEWTKHLVTVAAMLHSHQDRYAVTDQDWKVLAVEQEVVSTIGGQLYTQRMDLVVQSRTTGLVWIIDHKSSSRPSNKSGVLGFTLSGQFLGYRVLGERLWGDQFGGVIASLVGSTPPFDCIRVKPKPAPWAQSKFIDSIQWANEQMAALAGRDKEDYPKVLSDLVCHHRYGLCDHFDSCCYGGA